MHLLQKIIAFACGKAVGRVKMMLIMNLMKSGLLLCFLRCWRNLNYKASTILREQDLSPVHNMTLDYTR